MPSFASNSTDQVEVVAVEELPERKPKVVSITPPPDLTPIITERAPPAPPEPSSPPVVVQRVGIPEAMVAVFSALALALSARLLLLLSLCGAFVLALMAMQRQTIPAIGILIAYALLIVAPLVFLELKAKRHAGE